MKPKMEDFSSPQAWLYVFRVWEAAAIAASLAEMAKHPECHYTDQPDPEPKPKAAPDPDDPPWMPAADYWAHAGAPLPQPKPGIDPNDVEAMAAATGLTIETVRKLNVRAAVQEKRNAAMTAWAGALNVKASG